MPGAFLYMFIIFYGHLFCNLFLYGILYKFSLFFSVQISYFVYNRIMHQNILSYSYFILHRLEDKR